jgi:hypothetical protein
MRINCGRTHCAVNAALLLAVGVCGYYHWSESAARAQPTSRLPFPETWTDVSRHHAIDARSLGADAVQVGRAIEAMADALAAGDEAGYGRSLGEAESLSARAAGPRRDREALICAAQERHEQRSLESEPALDVADAR